MAARKIYLDGQEYLAIRTAADDAGTSVSSIVRIAVRALFGMPIPKGWAPLVEDRSPVIISPNRGTETVADR